MNSAATLILQTAQRGELHHAIIIHGPSPEPLRLVAMRIAKTLNCVNGTTGDLCAACQRIERRIHPDVHFVEVAAEKKLISIEQIRDLVNDAAMRPYEGPNKVFIIDPADALSAGGSNALLKTLEEPTRDTTFILITRSPDLLLPTIRSRSQSIYVGNESTRQIGASLETTRHEQVVTFASAAGRDALALQFVDALHRFATRRESGALLSIAATIGSSEEVKDAIALLATILCDAAALGGNQAIDAAKLGAIRENIRRERLLASADALMIGIRALNVNADARLVVEQALAHLVSDAQN